METLYLDYLLLVCSSQKSLYPGDGASDTWAFGDKPPPNLPLQLHLSLLPGESDPATVSHSTSSYQPKPSCFKAWPNQPSLLCSLWFPCHSNLSVRLSEERFCWCSGTHTATVCSWQQSPRACQRCSNTLGFFSVSYYSLWLATCLCHCLFPSTAIDSRGEVLFLAYPTKCSCLSEISICGNMWRDGWRHKSITN